MGFVIKFEPLVKWLASSLSCGRRARVCSSLKVLLPPVPCRWEPSLVAKTPYGMLFKVSHQPTRSLRSKRPKVWMPSMSACRRGETMLLCLYPFPHPVRRPLLPLKAEALRTFLASLQFKRRQALNITQGEFGKQWLLLLFFFRLQFLIKLVCSRFEVTILKAKKFTIFSPPLSRLYSSRVMLNFPLLPLPPSPLRPPFLATRFGRVLLLSASS